MAGSSLARRLAASEREGRKADILDRLATEIAEDRVALQEVMAALDVPVRLSETWASWTAERISQLRLNGRVFRRSQLSRVLEWRRCDLAWRERRPGGGCFGPAPPRMSASTAIAWTR